MSGSVPGTGIQQLISKFLSLERTESSLGGRPLANKDRIRPASDVNKKNILKKTESKGKVLGMCAIVDGTDIILL